MAKYVLYEGENGNMLFTKEEYVKANPNLLKPFNKKQPTWTCEADNDNSAVTLLNAQMMTKAAKAQKSE